MDYLRVRMSYCRVSAILPAEEYYHEQCTGIPVVEWAPNGMRQTDGEYLYCAGCWKMIQAGINMDRNKKTACKISDFYPINSIV